MNIKYFNEFKNAKNIGLKAKAKTNLDLFIDSFDNFEEKLQWVKPYLESKAYGHRIRHELYEAVIFPVLIKGYQENDPWSLYWLAETIQNIYKAKALHQKIGFTSDYALLRKCFATDQNNHEVRLSLLTRVIRALDFATHEWPTGVLYAPDESPDDLLKEIAYGRSLDKEKRYAGFFSDIEKIINEDKVRKGE